MKALIAKDLRLLAPYAWLILGGHVLFSANGAISPELLFWFDVAMAAFYTVGLAIIDWRFEAERFVASLPVDRAAIVWSRYVGGIGAAALGTGLYVLYGAVISSLLLDRLGWSEAGVWNSAGQVAAFFLLVTALVLLFLPFHYRFGLGRGIWGFLLATVVAAAVVIPLVNARTDATAGAPSRALGDALNSVVTGRAPVLAWMLVIAVMVALTWASAQLALAGYRARDL